MDRLAETPVESRQSSTRVLQRQMGRCIGLTLHNVRAVVKDQED